MLAIGVLAWRIAAIRGQAAVANAPRTAERTYLRIVARHVETYARTYRRPAYSLDSVVAHLDATNARLMRDLETDVWGNPVQYAWSRCGFTLRSGGGGSDASIDVNDPRWITERHAWPAELLPANSGCG
jgi:hypothetical protein